MAHNEVQEKTPNVVPGSAKFAESKITYRPRMWVPILKWTLILASLALIALAVQRLIEMGWWAGVVIVGALGSAILVVYGRRKSVAMKFVLPGLVLMLAFQVWPVLYTAATAFTNQGNGHMLSKEQAIESIINTSVQEVPGAPRYAMGVAVAEGESPDTGQIILLLTDPADGQIYSGTEEGLKKLDKSEVKQNDKGAVTSAPGYTLLNPKQINERTDLKDVVVPAETGAIRPQGLSQAFEGTYTMSYDAKADVLTDERTGTRYVAEKGSFVPESGEGQPLPTGWQINVGFSNFTKVFTDPVIRSGFIGIFLWNVAFSAIGVISTFILGMLLAILFNNEQMRGKRIYRSILVLPYAIPGFVTALVWKNMFNPDYGLINNMTGLNLDWYGDPVLAKVMILVANLWLGFPYMFIVCTGALQSIPRDIYEAAEVDRVGPLAQLTRITMPLLLVSVGPLLISSFSFNFNNFGLIYLMTEGGPFSATNTEIGSTDLLITYAYRMAFSGANPNYGMAAAVSILIFLLVMGMSLIGFNKSAALEDVN